MASKLDRLTDRQLLNLRFCDLPLRINGTRLEQRIEKLYREMDARSIPFRPHVWLSEEWFTPDNVGGFAIPFYLAHPRLIKLERSQMLEVEGAGEAECMRILRHEAGHAFSNAFRLHARRGWTDTFGSFRVPYPEWYQPQADSRDYVLNLDAWYAQAHPAEDFAETFAVWLKPGSRWRRQYLGWGAMRKRSPVILEAHVSPDESWRGRPPGSPKPMRLPSTTRATPPGASSRPCSRNAARRTHAL